MTLYRFINLIIFFNLFFLVICQYFVVKYNNVLILKIIRYTLEASLIGAIADTYAIFGLFHKIGPHTDILRRKKRELVEKTKEFVGNFLFDKNFLDRELKNFELNITEYFDEKELAESIYRNIERTFKNNKILKIVTKEIGEKIAELIIKKLIQSKSFNKNINKIGKELIKKIIFENHDIIMELIEKRLGSISDQEFIDMVKTSSWNELQWIRLNGLILGAFIGLVFGIFESLF